MNKSKINIKSLLAAVDSNDYNFYDNLTDEEKKDFSVWLANRFASHSDKFPAHYLMMVNLICNMYSLQIKSHPKLQWMLLASCGVGRYAGHNFIKPTIQKNNLKLVDILKPIFPLYKLDELMMLIKLSSENDLVDILQDYGYSIEDINKMNIHGK